MSTETFPHYDVAMIGYRGFRDHHGDLLVITIAAALRIPGQPRIFKF